MSEFVSSLIEYYKNRTKMQVFGVFGFWWFVFHVEYFIVLFFVGQDEILQKEDLLKNEYLNMLYGPYFDAEYLIRFTLPFILTWLTIYYFHKLIFNRFYLKEKENDYGRQTIKIKHESDINKVRAKYEKQNIVSLKTIEESKKKEQQIEKNNPEVIWEKEYSAFTANPLFAKFDQLIRCLYEYSGQTHVYQTFTLDKDLLAFVDVSGLVNYDQQSNVISLTDKGRFFVKTYQANGKLPF